MLLRIHRRKLGGYVCVFHKIFAQLSIKYTFSERLKNDFFKSTTILAILTFILEIRFEMLKTTPFASEAYLPTLLFACASFMLSSIFNILNTNTVCVSASLFGAPFSCYKFSKSEVTYFSFGFHNTLNISKNN